MNSPFQEQLPPYLLTQDMELEGVDVMLIQMKIVEWQHIPHCVHGLLKVIFLEYDLCMTVAVQSFTVVRKKERDELTLSFWKKITLLLINILSPFFTVNADP